MRGCPATKNLAGYLEPTGVIKLSGGESRSARDFAAFAQVVSPSTKGQFHCVLVDGAAGVGKTSLIERLVLDRSKNINAIPILHVTSRGRRLTNLRDALAGTITDLRAKFVPAEVPVLVRNNLLQVALDGFDEFVDPEGYKDAWAALKDFIRECGSGGPLILAGRDTFFDQQRFADQLLTLGKPEITTIRLTEVAPDEAKSWLSINGWSDSELSSDVTTQYLKPGSYILRPFFLSRIKDLRGWGQLRESRLTPQTFIIDSMVKREAAILAQPLSMQPLEVAKGLEILFEYIAEDMAEREVDSVPTHYLTFLGEVAFQGIIPEDSLARLMHSLGSIALLERGYDSDCVRFPHTEVTNRFLVRSLIRQLSNQNVPPFLGRIILGMDRIEAFAERMHEIEKAEGTAVVTKLENARKNERQTERMASNLTALLISTFCREDLDNASRSLSDSYANDVRVIYETASSDICRCNIFRMDARNCDLSGTIFENTVVSFLIVDRNTRFGASIPSIGVIQIDDPKNDVTLRSEKEKSEWLKRHSAINDIGEDLENRLLPLVKHFDRVCRRFQAQICIRENSEGDPGSYLLRGNDWEEIEKILLKFNRLKKEIRHTSGRPSFFYTVANPEGLLNPTDEDDQCIRGAVVNRAKELIGT